MEISQDKTINESFKQMRLIKPNFNNPKVDILERCMAASCYVSGGLLGLLFVIFFKKNAQTDPFFYFHFLQSIILALLFWLFKWTSGTIEVILTSIIQCIASLLPVVSPVIIPFTAALNWVLILIQSGFCLLIIYGLIFALLGKYAEIPPISALVRQNLR